jgi:hypothetical protein
VAEDLVGGNTYARVRFLETGATLERPSDGVVTEAVANTPVMPGDILSTSDGRAEFELVDTSVVWLDRGTRVAFRTLADSSSDPDRTDLVAIEFGTLRVESRDQGNTDAVFQVDTEAGSIFLLSAGSFRIEVRGPMTTLSCYGGVAEFSGDTGSVLVRSGQRSTVQRGRGPGEPRRFNTQRVDDFDHFHDDRVVAYQDAAAAGDDAQLPEEIRPYAPELSFFGTWQTVPNLGYVWRPYYAGAWSPYGRGPWSLYPTGWVWVSYDPWGWAPYHYGRWEHLSSLGWVWIPGSIWGGAWVTFAFGPAYVGWSPLNFRNQPVFHDAGIGSQPTVNVARLDPRGWQFLPIGRFGTRGKDQVFLRGDRLPRTTDLILTQALPRFDAEDIARHPDKAKSVVDLARRMRQAPPAVRVSAGEALPFRALERQARAARPPAVLRPAAGKTDHPTSGATAISAPPTIPIPPGLHDGSQPRVPEPFVSRPAPPPPSGAGPRSSGSTQSQKQSEPRGRSVERLLEGTRPPATSSLITPQGPGVEPPSMQRKGAPHAKPGAPPQPPPPPPEPKHDEGD